jgi:N-acetylglutamate synthase-like GNAT family acetyltransferase
MAESRKTPVEFLVVWEVDQEWAAAWDLAVAWVVVLDLAAEWAQALEVLAVAWEVAWDNRLILAHLLQHLSKAALTTTLRSSFTELLKSTILFAKTSFAKQPANRLTNQMMGNLMKRRASNQQALKKIHRPTRSIAFALDQIEIPLTVTS